MNNTDKLLADIAQLKKRDLSENGNVYDGERFCRKINNLFASNNRFIGETAASFVDYWFNTYILASKDIKNEPSRENMDRLVAIQSILDGSSEQTECLSKEDWKELCSIVDTEADDLPLDVLNELMSLFVEKQAF